MKPAYMLGLLAVAGGFGYWYLGSPAMASLTGGPTVPTVVSGTAARDLILSRFRAAGLSDNLAKAAAVNAYAESAWKSDAVGDSGHSVGLFQLNDRGLGKPLAMPMLSSGHPNAADPRFDAVKNIDAVIAECKRQSPIMGAQNSAVGTVKNLTALFTTFVERPADVAGDIAKRQALIPRLFPGSV